MSARNKYAPNVSQEMSGKHLFQIITTLKNRMNVRVHILAGRKLYNSTLLSRPITLKIISLSSNGRKQEILTTRG